MNLLRRLCHWGPLFALGIIKGITWAFVSCVQMWWPPQSSWEASFNYYSFLLLSTLTVINLLLAMHYGPGYLPLHWTPENKEDAVNVQYCTACDGYKAPRSHHCRKCKRCVMKMDHHCPWINNCVGHKNHTNFVLFLFFAVCGCAQACYNIGATLYAALNANYYYYYGPRDVPLVVMELRPFVFCLFSLGLSVGVVCAVGFLLYGQLKSIIRNVPGIEDWILEKAAYRREGTEETFKSPYDLGRWKNFTQVFNFSFKPRGDGITWPVREGCTQYTFTLEQMDQKKAKRERAVEYNVDVPYNGRWIPLKHGWKVWIRPPCTDEPRLVIKPTDKLLVTRWKRYWLYGEIIERDSVELNVAERRKHRGWFPRHCTSVSVRPTEEDKKSQ